MTAHCWSAKTATARFGGSSIEPDDDRAFGVGPIHSCHAGDRRTGIRAGGADRAVPGVGAVGPDDIRRLAVGRAAADGVCTDAVCLCSGPGRAQRSVWAPAGAADLAERDLRELSDVGLGAVADMAVRWAADRRGDGGERG